MFIPICLIVLLAVALWLVIYSVDHRFIEHDRDFKAVHYRLTCLERAVMHIEVRLSEEPRNR